jgi:RNA polymerase sigma-70 factor, ECF subfamily
VAVTKLAQAGHEHGVAPPSAPASGQDRAGPEELGLIYEAHFGFVWRTLGYLGLEGAAREDAAQDVFLVAHRRLPDFEHRASLQTWLYAVTRNVVRNHRRGVRRRGPEEPVPVELVSSEPGPEESCQRNEAFDFVRAFLSSLDEAKREVFLLCELEQLPAADVAELLGTNPNTVSSRLRLARAAFQKAVDHHRSEAR